jgi:hypothetical protein
MRIPILSTAARPLPLAWVFLRHSLLLSLSFSRCTAATQNFSLLLLPHCSMPSNGLLLQSPSRYAAVDRSRCCTAHRHQRQRGWQKLQALGLACPLPSRYSSVVPPSSSADFWSCDGDAQISSVPYRLGDALTTIILIVDYCGFIREHPVEGFLMDDNVTS